MALATLYQSRLKKKEEAMKVKYFVNLMQHPLPAATPLQESGVINNTTAGAAQSSLYSSAADRSQPIHKAAELEQAKLTYENELINIRKIEESISGVKFDKFGLVTAKSLENKIKKLGVLYTMAELATLSVKFLAKIKRDQKKVYDNINSIVAKSTAHSEAVSDAATQSRAGLGYKEARLSTILPGSGTRKVKVKKGFYKMLFKKFEFNNINNDLQLFTLQIKKKRAGKINKSKLFKVFAKTYLNIFKFKVNHPIFNKLKLR